MAKTSQRIPSDSDLELQRRLHEGDDAVYAYMWNVAGPQVDNALRNEFPQMSTADRENAVDESLLEVWMQREKFDASKASLVGFMLHVGRRRLIDALRKYHGNPPAVVATPDHVNCASDRRRNGSVISEFARHEESLQERAGPDSRREADVSVFLDELTAKNRAILVTWIEHGRDDRGQPCTWTHFVSEKRSDWPALRQQRKRLYEKLKQYLVDRGHELPEIEEHAFNET